ncbi:conserved hypothetical protein [Flexibacter flexilis DSM 6793]|uniref:DUF4440 domain-containing protein n=1 Tax=Flexibacter flexilis DSM 6793 TaxID=927664 RepID=A0A1I1G696_9BACT|nr:SgcJ/EcaC family oxidoreductase [Flexibacter flexilis]SFC04833.1 conserved hypothetical protein [Flexibacter flexilis DSM 6793]
MKKLFALLVVLFSVSFSNQIYAQSSEKEAVTKVVKAYFEALNASDASKIVALFTADGQLFAPSAPTAVGTEQLQGTYKYVFDNLTLSLVASVANVTVDGNYAFVTSTSKGSLLVKANNQKSEQNYRELFVLQKVKGSWKIVRYMYNQPA